MQTARVDISIASATGASQTLIAGTVLRGRVWISNPSDTDVWWINETGGTAAANAAGCFKLLPGQRWSTEAGGNITGIGTITTKLSVVYGSGDDPDTLSAASAGVVAAAPAVAFNSGVISSTTQRVVEADNAGPTTSHRLVSAAASTNLTNIKASAAKLHRIRGLNAAAAVTYLKIWNKASVPVPGSDAALLTHTFALQASVAFDIVFPKPRYFDTGMGYGLFAAAGGADTATTAVTAGDILGLQFDYT